MDFEGRASRRPMPRQLDVSDWNVDSDVRSGVSSSLSRYSSTERATVDTRAAPADVNRRLSNGNELRPAATATLRPVNRYDADTTASSRVTSESAGSVSSWRASVAFMPSSVRRTERTEERRTMASVPSERLQPRSMQDPRRYASGTSSSYVSTNSLELEEPQPLRYAWDREPRVPQTANDVAASSETGSTDASYRPEIASTYSPPPRESVREPTTPATVYSDASTDVSSPPFTSSITDTPSTNRSSSRTPPFTPASDDTPTRPQYSSPSPAHYTASEVSSNDSSPETDALPDRDASDSATVSIRPSRSISRSSASGHGGLSLQQQREQLYDFRRNMRQVFARVDEMVDMHRDLFKSDPMSGMPQFNATIAHETASFTNETFAQLTALRSKFKELAKAWTPPDDSQREESRYSPRRRGRGSSQRPTQSDETSSVDTMHNSSQIASSESMETIEPPSSTSSVSSSSPRAAVAHRTLGLGRPCPIPRWEPTLSSLSNHSSSSSSSSSSTSPAEPSLYPATTLPVFRPYTDTSRLNVFEDFDKRMEEIRASLNSIARDRPRVSAPASSPSQSSSTSSWAPSSTPNKFRTSEADSSSDQESTTLENNSRAGNRIHQAANNESREDREARLRQLLRELRETGDTDDDAASAWG